MAQRHVAICTDIDEFNGNRILVKDYAAIFPGALWVSHFAEVMKKWNIDVVTGDVAIENLINRKWHARDVFVIQELDATHGAELLRFGCVPFLLAGFESPLFAYDFYDKLPNLAPEFENRLLFSGALSTFEATSGRNFPAHFPSFASGRDVAVVPWNRRKAMVLVAANKTFPDPFRIRLYRNPMNYWRWLKRRAIGTKSVTIDALRSEDLHGKRLAAIEYFGKRGWLDLFGTGWLKRRRLPFPWRTRFYRLLRDLNPQWCDDKIETISRYKFAICFENMSYPGYLTEKIFDCFVAGVIPIYLGAPDIADLVPKKAYIDVREFRTWGDLAGYLDSITDDEAMQRIFAAREFLRSAAGQAYSFVGVAQFVENLMEARLQANNERQGIGAFQ